MAGRIGFALEAAVIATVAMLVSGCSPRLIPKEASNKSPEKTLTNSIGMKFMLIPAGEFQMGSPANEEGREDWEQQHRVRITHPFYLGAYEVTQEQFQQVMGNNPSDFKGVNLPVEQVSRDDAVEFCRKLSQEEGKIYRLPTEAEWEYACRAGTKTAFAWGNSASSAQANINGNASYGDAAKGPSIEKTSSVGSYMPNAFGLYDMHGNVWEWCSDWYGSNYYPNSPADDPVGPGAGSGRVFRGGSWFDYPVYCRTASRSIGRPADRTNLVGFRVLQER